MVSRTSGTRPIHGKWGMRKLWGYDGNVNGFPRRNDQLESQEAQVPHKLGFNVDFFGTTRSRWIYPYLFDLQFSFGRSVQYSGNQNVDKIIFDHTEPVRLFYYEGPNYVRYYVDGKDAWSTWTGINAGEAHFEITFFDNGDIEIVADESQSYNSVDVEMYRGGFLRKSFELESEDCYYLAQDDVNNTPYTVYENSHAESDATHNIFEPDVDGTVVVHTDENIGPVRDEGWFKRVPACDPADVSESFLRVGSGGNVRALPMAANGDVPEVRMENPSGQMREMQTYNTLSNQNDTIPDHYENEGRGPNGSHDRAGWAWSSDHPDWEDYHRFNYVGGQYEWWDISYPVFTADDGNYNDIPMYNVERIRAMWVANYNEYSSFESGDYALGVMDPNGNWQEDLTRTTPERNNNELVFEYSFGSPQDILAVAAYPINNVSDMPSYYFDYEPNDSYSAFAAESSHTYAVQQI